MKWIIAFLALIPLAASAENCKVEQIKGGMKGTETPYLQGVMSCERGKISYHIYEKETGDFIASGFHYFDGFVFGIYPPTDYIPNDFDFRYMVE